VLLQQRSQAAAEIGLDLGDAESMMLNSVPEKQLEAIIAQTRVPQEHRRAFLGKAAGAMLAALGATGAGAASAGIEAILGRHVVSQGGRPDMPEAAAGATVESRVIALIAAEAKTPEALITAETSFVADLQIDSPQREAVCRSVEREFGVAIGDVAFARFRTVGDLVDHVEMVTTVQPQVIAIIAQRLQVAPPQVIPEASLADDLKVSARQLADLRQDLVKSFDVYIPWTAFKAAETVGEVIACTGAAVKRRREAEAKQQPQPYEIPSPVTRGSRPDPPPPYGSFGNRPDPPPPNPSDWRGGIGGIRPGSSP